MQRADDTSTDTEPALKAAGQWLGVVYFFSFTVLGAVVPYLALELRNHGVSGGYLVITMAATPPRMQIPPSQLNRSRAPTACLACCQSVTLMPAGGVVIVRCVLMHPVVMVRTASIAIILIVIGSPWLEQ